VKPFKIGIYLPVLTFDRFGYQYNYKIVLNNLSAFADNVYCVFNGPIEGEAKILESKYPNVKFIFNELTHTADDEGNLIFDIPKQIEAGRFCIETMINDGVDIAISLHINQYIPESSWRPLREYCSELLNKKRRYGWIHKRYQCINKLFDADIMVPWILNLNPYSGYYFSPDSISNRKGEVVATIATGDYRKFHDRSIVDFQFEHSISDLEEKVNFVRNYEDLNKTKRRTIKPHFNRKEHLQYLQNKINKKVLSPEQIDKTGTLIWRNNQPEFLSNMLLRNYAYPSLTRRIYRKYQAQSSTILNFLSTIRYRS
jgi:hypothetical protein